MRKLGTIGALVMAAAILFTSCEKIETSELTLDLTQTATVKVYLFAELNQTTNGLESVPNGTNVIVSIPNNAFNSSASGLWTTNAVVANGAIEVTVPATNIGVSVTFTPAEFLYAQVQGFGANAATIQKLYKANLGPYILGAVKPGEIRSYNITYNLTETPINYTETVSRKFELRADIDATTTTGGLQETVPQNTVVTFYNTTFMTTATVGAGGIVTVNLPWGQPVSARFQAIKTLTLLPNVTTKNYRYTATFNSYTESSPVAQYKLFTDEPWE
jgi:hypothetical protein